MLEDRRKHGRSAAGQLLRATVVVKAAEASEAAVEIEFAEEPEPVQVEAEVAEAPAAEGEAIEV